MSDTGRTAPMTMPHARSDAPLTTGAAQPIEAGPSVTCVRACPVCGGSLYEIRHKLHCERCHTIVETCCEGGRG